MLSLLLTLALSQCSNGSCQRPSYSYAPTATVARPAYGSSYAHAYAPAVAHSYRPAFAPASGCQGGRCGTGTHRGWRMLGMGRGRR